MGREAEGVGREAEGGVGTEIEGLRGVGRESRGEKGD